MAATTDFKLMEGLSIESFHKPARIVSPYSWVQHIPFAFWLMNALRPRTVVELGTHTGNSFFAFCEAAKLFDTASILTAIDTWQGDVQAGLYGNEIFEEVSQYRDTHYAKSATLVRSTFDAARHAFAAGSIDLLHIDGLHTYEAVRHDFETYRSTVSDRGVVLFHDTCVRGRDFGVWQLWQELAAQFPSFEFKHGHGLGVLGVGREIPGEVQKLFQLPDDSASLYRTIYHRLGESVFDWDEISVALNSRNRLQQIESSRSWKLANRLTTGANLVRRCFAPARR